jgi:hypothetical protein
VAGLAAERVNPALVACRIGSKTPATLSMLARLDWSDASSMSARSIGVPLNEQRRGDRAV